MSLRTKCVVLLVIGIFTLRLSSSIASATEGVAISPSRLNISLIPGEQATGTFLITNNTASAVSLKASTESLNINGNNVPITLNPTDEFQVNTGASQVVSYSIGPLSFTNNEALEGQGKIGFVQVAAGGSGGSVLFKLTVLVNVRLVNAKADIIVSDIQVSPSKPQEGEPVTLTAILKNENTSGGGVATDNCKDSGRFNVKWYVNGTRLLYTRVNNLKAGEEISVTFQRPHGIESKLRRSDLPIKRGNLKTAILKDGRITLPVAGVGLSGGIASVKFEADVDSQVDEADENNNTLTKEISLGGIAITPKVK